MSKLYCPICYEELKQSYTGETYCPEGCYCSSGSRLEPLNERQHLEKHIKFYEDRVKALNGKIRDMQYKLDRMD